LRALKFAVILMGALIIAGTVALGVLVAGRLAGPASPRMASLDLPQGARIAGIATAGDHLALLIENDGPARVMLWDPRRGALIGTVAPHR
jgi:hypothetical protein